MSMSDRIRVLAIGVFRVGDRVLLARGTDPESGESFYRPLGGGVEFGERAADALTREITEELGAAIQEPRLLGVLENRFRYAGRPHHEIVFVFDARFSDPAWYERAALPVIETGAAWEDARWISLDELAAGAELVTPAGLLPLLQAAFGDEVAHAESAESGETRGSSADTADLA
jgi:ADP-ribose pyrophosphatase YjhB (NUDIX family)